MKNSYSFIVIEDVPLQRENLIGMLSGRMDLRLIDSFETAESAYQFLCNTKNESIDLIFLDIELPERKGVVIPIGKKYRKEIKILLNTETVTTDLKS